MTNRTYMTFVLDRLGGKAVRIRHCPATVKRNETGYCHCLDRGGKAPA